MGMDQVHIINHYCLLPDHWCERGKACRIQSSGSIPFTDTGTPSNILLDLPSLYLCVDASAAARTLSFLTSRKAALCSGTRANKAWATAVGVNLPDSYAE